MVTILIVDDSAVERRLAGGLLQGSPDFALLYAENGKDALACIAQTPPDIVVTDLVMPEMDGLELVRALRSSHPKIPVILMTAYGNEAVAADAMRQGAVSYVPKSRRADTLLQTVRQVLARAQAGHCQERLSKYLDRIESVYVLENDPLLIKPLLDMVENTLASVGLTDEIGRLRIGVAIEEALLNAIYHGNLSVGEASYAEAKQSGTSNRLAEDRREEPPFCDRKITFKMSASKESAQFVIRDEGSGCPGILLQAASEPQDVFESGRHRGIVLMRHLMDDVRYNAAGNEVKLSVRSGQPV